MFLQWFAKFQTSPLWFYGLLGLLLTAYLWRARREEYVLFSTGFMVMGSEILVIFAFQVYYGYIYTQIGLIVTVFLAGPDIAVTAGGIHASVEAGIGVV